MSVKYLSAEDILVIHAKMIDETSGFHGVRDINLLKSLVERPKTKFGGAEMYPSIYDKAAVYLHSLCQYHVFIDGNKRTSIAVGARFLFLNGYEFMASNKELEEFILKVVVDKLSLKIIASWFENYSKKI